VKAEHRFRIASLSKPVTAAAVMRLAETGMVDLDDPAFAYVDHLEPPPGATEDPRLADVTVRHLLEHSGGWDRSVSPDPLFLPYEAAAAVGEPAPASPETIIRYMLGRPLDFDPGSRYAYSNFGYTVLGRIIEDVTGLAYDEYVISQVLAPMGIERMAIGRTRASERQEPEVAYHDLRGATGQSVYSGEGLVPTPYGTFYQEGLDAVGGWIASPVDLMRFVTSVDGRADRPDLIGPSTVEEMTARPDMPY
jgi:N-acyl-D-amino-acid deacylase